MSNFVVQPDKRASLLRDEMINQNYYESSTKLIWVRQKPPFRTYYHSYHLCNPLSSRHTIIYETIVHGIQHEFARVFFFKEKTSSTIVLC